MRCLYPRTVGFRADGKTLSWGPKYRSREFPTFQLPCGKCRACRLERAREMAVRCVHEAMVVPRSCFVTLTYDDEHLESSKLIPDHGSQFLKDLRTKLFSDLLNSLFPFSTQRVQRKLWRFLPEYERDYFYEKRVKFGALIVGEYGDKGKRPHFHAVIFNWRPSDSVYSYTSDLGDRVFTSSYLDAVWKRGKANFGAVTFKSAGYVARYSAKKLVHGKDGEHEFEPVARRSQRNAIGKRWLELHWKDIFSYGYCVLPDGVKSGVPRYYEKWLKKAHPDAWKYYVTQVKPKVCLEAERKESMLSLEEARVDFARRARDGLQFVRGVRRIDAERVLMEERFARLQKGLKL